MAPEAVTSHHHQGDEGALVENAASSTITSPDHEGLPGQGEIEVDLKMTLKHFVAPKFNVQYENQCMDHTFMLVTIVIF